MNSLSLLGAILTTETAMVHLRTGGITRQGDVVKDYIGRSGGGKADSEKCSLHID